MTMTSEGIGYLNYFADAWLYGKTSYNIISLDYEDAIVAYGCDSYFWIFHYEYFWVLNRKPIVSYAKQMYYMNYIRSKFPNYANRLPIHMQGEKCFSEMKSVILT